MSARDIVGQRSVGRGMTAEPTYIGSRHQEVEDAITAAAATPEIDNDNDVRDAGVDEVRDGDDE